MRWFLFFILLSLLVLMFSSGCCDIRPPRGYALTERPLEVTGYCKCGKCCGWHRTWYGRPVYSSGNLKGQTKRIGITATGTKARHGTIAADTTLYPFGTVMYVRGYGYGRVEDVGGDIKGHHIDLYFHSHVSAEIWGKKKMMVKIWMPPSKKSK